MKHCTRRDFLKTGLSTGLPLGATTFLTGCGATPPSISVPADTPKDHIAEVTAVRGKDLYGMTRDILDAIGGIESVVHPGETVFIKPNLSGLGFLPGNSFVRGESTKVEILVVVAEECLKAGAASVVIGEGSIVSTFAWDEAVTLDGTTNLAAEALRLNETYPGKVTLACLEADSPAWDPLPSPHTDLGDIYVTSLMARADRVISIAPIKTNRWTHTTASLKNFVGTTSFKQYGNMLNWRTQLHSAAGGISQCFLDIVAALRPDLAIIDGSIGVEANGPHVYPELWGSTVDVRKRLGDWFLLAGTDLAAIDATAARIIGHDVDRIPHLTRAYEQGIGQIHQDKIELAGATLAELQMDWIPAEYTEGFGEVVVPALVAWIGAHTTGR
jgi:uncharacterized protein (DUF362 family)